MVLRGRSIILEMTAASSPMISTPKRCPVNWHMCKHFEVIGQFFAVIFTSLWAFGIKNLSDIALGDY